MSATTIGVVLVSLVAAVFVFEVFVDMGRAAKDALRTLRNFGAEDWFYYGVWAALIIGVGLILWDQSVYS